MRFILALAALLLWTPVARAAELQLFNWQDYIAPQVLERFHAATGIRVNVTTYASNEEMYQGVRHTPGRYDLIVPDQYMVDRMAAEGLLDPFDATRLPRFYNIEPAWIGTPHDPTNRYSVPYLCGTTAFAVDSAALPDTPASLATLFQPPLKAHGKVALLAELDEVFALAAIHLGLPICTESEGDLKRIEALLHGLRPHVAAFPKEDLARSIADPRHLIHMAWNGDVLRARAERPQMTFVYPREGVLAWLSAMAVPKDAPNKAAALQFIDFLLTPEVAALQTEYTGYANAVLGSEAFLAPDMQRAPEFAVPPSVRMVFVPRCSPAALEKRKKVLHSLTVE